MSSGGEELNSAVQREGSFMSSLKAVAWSFFGIRKASGYEKDITQLNPVHVVIAGVLGAGLFVLGLVALVNWVLSSGVAK
jgi:hypothetical protein